MTHALRPCASCARHVRHEDAVCPFCSAVMTAIDLDERGESPLFRGLSRASLLVAGALTLAACGRSNNDPNMAAAYGGPPSADPTSGNEPPPAEATTSDAGQAAREAPLYGAAPPK
ncbi:MAG: hypothetical protein JNK05_12495 [Myxococcales bacterium]|nr:hypothetical protein [Myxococcales bacterium]